MAMVNIPSTCSDPQYRYKMPRLMSKKEGRGNGSKTCITNMGDVARALKRPPQYTTKWFGSELGAQSTYTRKEGEGERAIINGHHDTPIFVTLLDKFIEKYVLCSNCHLPEIDMYVKKGNIQAKCMACGWAGDLDNAHKLAAFISKNPPDESGTNIVNLAEGGGKKTREKKKNKADEKADEKKPDDEVGSADDESDEAEKNEKKKKKKEKKHKEEKDDENKKEKKKKKKKSKDEDNDDDDDDDDAPEVKKKKKHKKHKEDKDEKKEKKDKKDKKDKKKKKAEKEDSDDSDDERQKSKGKKEAGGSDGEDSDASGGSGKAKKARDGEELDYDDQETGDVISTMAAFVESQGGRPSVEDFFEELRMQQLAKLFNTRTRLYIALEALCGTSMDAKALSEKKKYVSKCITQGKMDAEDILWAFGAYLDRNSGAAKTYAHVLKVLYDEDWAEEKDILSYYDEDEGSSHPGFDAAKQAATPFLKWLKTADDDSEEEGSSDDDDDEDSN